VNVNELLDYAIDEVRNIKANEIFLVKDLFKGYRWNRIPRRDRILLGTLFLNTAKNESSYLDPIEKTSSGQQKYRKKAEV
jgi:hypothetical protein